MNTCKYTHKCPHKILFVKYKWRKYYIHLIQLGVS